MDYVSTEQLRELHRLATEAGLDDAANWIGRVGGWICNCPPENIEGTWEVCGVHNLIHQDGRTF